MTAKRKAKHLKEIQAEKEISAAKIQKNFYDKTKIDQLGERLLEQ